MESNFFLDERTDMGLFLVQPMKIEFIEKAEFLKIELSDTFHYDSFIEFVVALGSKKAKKFLIDGSKLENTDLSYKERYDIGNTAVDHLDIRLKYVVIWKARDINYFAISIMRLRGFDVKVFDNMSSAKEWLLI